MKQKIRRIIEKFGFEITKKKTKNFINFNALKDLRDSKNSDQTSLESQFLYFVECNYHQSSGQLFQDLLVNFFIDKKEGTFIEFGACDGVTLSNTLYLEKKLNWTGILGEPAKKWEKDLRNNRPNCTIETKCIYTKTGDILEFLESDEGEYSALEGHVSKDTNSVYRKNLSSYEVETISLNDLLKKNNIQSLDYLSIDTEGSEYEIISNYDFNKIKPKIITIEHNYTNTREKIWSNLTKNGYTRILEDFSQFDDWYILSDELKKFESY
jgi:FkbM family methyltransferase